MPDGAVIDAASTSTSNPRDVIAAALSGGRRGAFALSLCTSAI
jgi:hypothetical protein